MRPPILQIFMAMAMQISDIYIYIYVHISSGCYIQNMDIYSGCYIQNIYIYIMEFGNLGTNAANGSIRILTLDIISRIYIYKYPDVGNLGTNVAKGSVRILTYQI
jgi:hypothetical protein